MLSNPFQEFSPEVSKQVSDSSTIRSIMMSTDDQFLFQILAIENDSMLSPIEKERRKRLCLYGLSECLMNGAFFFVGRDKILLFS